MNGLEALKFIRPCANVCGDYDKYSDIIEKELEALEIIKEKGLSSNELWFIKNDKSFEEYTETLKELYYGDETLEKRLKTKDEFDLLKEVLQ